MAYIVTFCRPSFSFQASVPQRPKLKLSGYEIIFSLDIHAF